MFVSVPVAKVKATLETLLIVVVVNVPPLSVEQMTVPVAEIEEILSVPPQVPPAILKLRTPAEFARPTVEETMNVPVVSGKVKVLLAVRPLIAKVPEAEPLFRTIAPESAMVRT